MMDIRKSNSMIGSVLLMDIRKSCDLILMMKSQGPRKT